MYLGGCVRGIVKILIPKTLRPGQVMLKLETSITCKVRSKINPVNYRQIIGNYKKCIEPITVPRPLKRTFLSKFNLRGLTIGLKSKINKVHNLEHIQKLKKFMRRGRSNPNNNLELKNNPSKTVALDSARE